MFPCIQSEKALKSMEGILKGRTEAELKRQAGILGKTITNNAQMVNSIVNASFHNATFSDRIWNNSASMKADLDKLIQSGLIAGKNANVLAKNLQKYFIGEPRLKNGKKGAKYRAETLMRTELARVQTEAQKQSFIRNGFSQYQFIVNGGCCDICEEIKGKVFDVEKMMPGENAPPMHPRCRCSIAAYSERKEYEAWLDYLENGGTTAEWEAKGKAEWDKAQVNSYEGAPKKWGKIQSEEEKQDLKVINPNYKSSVSAFASDEELAYNHNCMNCIVAYDLRQRGHNVEARSFLECDIRRKADELWIGSKERKKKGDIAQFLSETSGTTKYRRYFIGHSDKTKSHALIAEYENGKIKVIDAQTAKVYNSLEKISNLLDGNIEYWRIDDLEVTQTAYNACKGR